MSRELSVSKITAIINHLEFMGYQIQRTETVWLASHPRKSDFAFYDLDDYIVIKQIIFTKEYGKFMRDELLEFVNDVNAIISVGRFHALEGGELMISSSYHGDYDKVTFARIMELFENDVDTLFSCENAGDFV